MTLYSYHYDLKDFAYQQCFKYEVKMFTAKDYFNFFNEYAFAFSLDALDSISFDDFYVLAGHKHVNDKRTALVPISLSDSYEELIVLADVNGLDPLHVNVCKEKINKD